MGYQDGHQDVQDMEASGESHRMSIALTIGATIGLIGLVILLYGLFGNADYSRSGGININLWWGLLMVIFGLIMSAGGYISSRRRVVH
jgi:drug/metabolite transporter (DMT)-like permease